MSYYKRLGRIYYKRTIRQSRIYYNTLDLDFKTKEELALIISKISKCNHFIKFKEISDSYKGFHLAFICSSECDLCRLVFDDQLRYYYDLFRPVYSRNVLFDTKHLYRYVSNTNRVIK